MRAFTYDHSCLLVDGLLELLKIYIPLRSRGRPSRSVLGWVQRNISNLAARHLNIANVPMPYVSSMGRISSFLDNLLVKERLEDDHFITRLNESHESTQHSYNDCEPSSTPAEAHRQTFIGSRCNGDLRVRVQLSAERRGVRIGNGFLQAWTTLWSGR